MSETLRKRLMYQGGNQEGRFQRDKLNSLKKALLYSYQAETAVVTTQLQDRIIEEQFRCLINDDKLKGDYDNKILSIPYEDICLNKREIFKDNSSSTSNGMDFIGNQITTAGLTPTKLKTGSTFLWKQTNTHWLIYLEYLQEDSYLRAEIRRCDQQVQVNGKPYWVYIRGPVETSIQWNQKASIEWNDLNHSLVMYITKDQNTVDFFHRFTKFKIKDPNSNDKLKTWQVVNANAYFADDIIEVYFDEYFENSMEQARLVELEQIEKNKPQQFKELGYIEGPDKVRCYDVATYKFIGDDEGYWSIIDNKGQTYYSRDKQVDITFNIGKSANWILVFNARKYRHTLPIVIESI